MWRAGAASLDLDHDDDRATYRGLAHRRCSRSAGQATAQQRVRARRQHDPDNVVVNSRRWCRQGAASSRMVTFANPTPFIRRLPPQLGPARIVIDRTGCGYSTERSRRLRKHRSGDHSLCLPERDCNATGATATPNATPTAEEGPRTPRLRARGRRMWDQLIGDGDPVEVVVLVEEICRCADRLDRPGWTGLDAIVNGRDRARLTVEVDDAGEVTVGVDKVHTEAGQQQSTFKALRAELRRGQAGGGTQPAGGRQPKASAGGDGAGGITDLTARIAQHAQPAG